MAPDERQAQQQRHESWLAAHPEEAAWRAPLDALAGLIEGATVRRLRVDDGDMFQGESRSLWLELTTATGGRARLSIAIGCADRLVPDGAPGARDWHSDEATEAANQAVYDQQLGLLLFAWDYGESPAWDNAETVCIPGFDSRFFAQDPGVAGEDSA